MNPQTRPVTKFEFAQMWGGPGFDPDLVEDVQREIDVNSHLDPEDLDSIRWEAIAYWTGGPISCEDHHD